MPYVPYSDDVETPFPDEARITAEIVAKMGQMQRDNADKHRHAHRDAHAKSHAILKGRLRVHDGLDDDLAQGIFSTPGEYDVLARLSSAPSDIHTDQIPAPRGFAIKVIGVPGDRLSSDLGGSNQDFLLVNIPVLAFGDVGKYQELLGPLEAKAKAPESLQRLGTAAARGVVGVVEALGRDPGATLQGLASNNDVMLADTFHSQAAIRYGDRIAKISLTPDGPVESLAGQKIGRGFSAMRDAIAEWFSENGATYTLRAQLCTDLDAMPVEDAAILWDPEASPHHPVATLTFPPQDPYSPGRRVWGDDHLAFNPWNGVTAHRPLGSIMRVRKPAYEQSSLQRHALNCVPRMEPDTLSEIPD